MSTTGPRAVEDGRPGTRGRPSHRPGPTARGPRLRTTPPGTPPVKSSALATAALAAAARGHFVLPLWPRSKVPAHHGRDRCPGSGPCRDGHAGWEQRATLDAAQLQAWWQTCPELNVGIATGPSGLHVIDLDPAGAGDVAPEAWQDLRHGRDVLARIAEQAGQPFPGDTFTVRTPSGGVHLYFRAPEVPQLRNTAGLVGWRVDSRGHGGLVVAPGSKTRAGTYEVEADRAIADLPAWLVPLLTPPAPPVGTVCPRAAAALDAPGHAVAPAPRSRRAKYLHAVTERVATAPGGQRRYTLLRAAASLGRLVAGGEYDEDEVIAALHAAAARLWGYPAREAARTIADGLHWGLDHPRRLSA